MAIFITFLLLQLALLAASLPSTNPNLTIHNNSTGIITIHPINTFAVGSTTPITALDLNYKCETTTGSPQVDNIFRSVKKLQDLPTIQMCYQTNLLGSHCTKMAVTRDATISICGVYNWGIPCWMAAEAGLKIADACEWKGLAGGIAWFNWQQRSKIVVH